MNRHDKFWLSLIIGGLTLLLFSNILRQEHACYLMRKRLDIHEDFIHLQYRLNKLMLENDLAKSKPTKD